MDNQNLTDEQFAKLVDFLYRWGLKSPELLSELADHYSEKALERMDQGYSWEQVLKSFKTKETYLNLRRLQAQHDKLNSPQWWRTVLKELRNVILQPVAILLLIALVPILYLSVTSDVTAPFMSEVIAMKAFIILAIAVYYGKYHKATKHSTLLNSGRYFHLMVFNFAFLHIFITQFILDSNGPKGEGVISNPSHAWFFAAFVGVSVLFDIVIIRFIRKAKDSSRRIYPEVLNRINQ